MFAIASMVTFWVYAIVGYSQALSNSSISELLYIFTNFATTLNIHQTEYLTTK
jgi:hypothetical protein